MNKNDLITVLRFIFVVAFLAVSWGLIVWMISIIF